MIGTLQHAGRMDADDIDRVNRRNISTAASSSPEKAESPMIAEIHHDAETAATPPYEWDENGVGAWLETLGLGQHAAAFAKCRVDGRLLLRIDDEDLADELGVSSRLERKRILAQIERLRAEIASET